MANEKKSFLLRLDPSLWNDLERWAAADLRSVNGQIEYILREAVRVKLRPAGIKTDAGKAADSADPGSNGIAGNDGLDQPIM